ncbi:hypothetical protein [Aureimonas jatrophae]|uniref:Uncharacterized protein n=1 Tax=Aureimonas jatrophae TaxID=1166073 RepID=A0A1H0JB98_9HYPH|nr:hypothetical protein [Aureimonas jatrophae]MBB3951501.1 hypothetical protein [Aureimonas jatrophae]SDO40872.1 hypothetical protein SAMN05192530_10694 [Aureimonas jatrophae]
MVSIRIEDASLSEEELGDITGATLAMVDDLRRRRLISSGMPGDPVSFKDACFVLAWCRFTEMGVGDEPQDEFTTRSACASLSMMPLLAFASEAARARYDMSGPMVRTTHPDHVPGRYVIVSGDRLVRVDALAAFEEARRDWSDRDASVLVFDAKVAAEHLLDCMGRPPQREVHVSD